MSFVKELGRALIKLRLAPLVRIKQKDFVLRLYPSSISLLLWVNSWRKKQSYPEDEDFFRSYLREGDVVVDVGANIGFFTLISAVTVGESGKVYAIEAHPRTFKFLEGNIAANKFRQVCAWHVALGDKAGTAHFSNRKHDDRNSIVGDENGIAVPMARLDELEIAEGSIALLKVDVEGYEKFVFEGAQGILPRVNCVYFESWDKWHEQQGYSCGDVLAILRGAGLGIYKAEVQRLVAVEGDYHSPECENLIAIRDLDDFRARTGMEVVEVAGK